MTEAIVLVPGFFGFGTFGDEAGGRFSYFADVAKVIDAACPGRFTGRIVAHEPPPTGSIASRVATLHDRVASVVASGADRVHLIGHSAGGVDARMFANLAYRWPGAPGDDERANLVARVGSVVTVSSPLYGTPIAVRLRTDHQLLLVAVQLLSVLAKGPEVPFLARAIAAPYASLAHALHRDPIPGEGVMRLLTHLDPTTIDQVRRFFREIETDRALLDDLSPAVMTRIVQGLRASDHPRIASYVTVSPPPRIGLGDLVPRLLYTRAYDGTRDRAFRPGTWPAGAWIGPRDAGREHDVCANDGVVPVASQTLDGHAAGIVEGDHLDIVGHYEESANGAVVFKSGAGFDARRFAAFWTDVAARL